MINMYHVIDYTRTAGGDKYKKRILIEECLVILVYFTI